MKKNNILNEKVWNWSIFKTKEVIDSLEDLEVALKIIEKFSHVSSEDNRYIEFIFCQAVEMTHEKLVNDREDYEKLLVVLNKTREVLMNHEENKVFSLNFLEDNYDISN